jgi:hypothetical protein
MEANNKIHTSVDQYCCTLPNSNWPESLSHSRTCLESPYKILARSNGQIENYNCCCKPGLLRFLRQNPNLTLLGSFHKVKPYQDPWPTLCFFCLYYVKIEIFLIFQLWMVYFCIRALSCILFYIMTCIGFHASLILFMGAYTKFFLFRLSGRLATYLMTFSQGLSLCKPQLFAKYLDWWWWYTWHLIVALTLSSRGWSLRHKRTFLETKQ